MAGSTKMKYNRLGDTGLLVSQLSLGSWITFDTSGAAGTIAKDAGGEKVAARARAAEAAYEIMKCAYDGGINFFDNAEGYANGDSERIMGDAVNIGVERGAWDRQDLVLTTKIFFGADTKRSSMKSNRFGLSRKHVIEGLQAALQRMGLDHVDVVFCHRPDPLVPMEEVVRAFNSAIDRGLCFYWATSEWSAVQLLQAKVVADRLGLIPPCADQPEYSLFARDRVESEYEPLYGRAEHGGMGLGLTIWSPLASGVLTGKYGNGIPPGSRLDKEDFRKRPDYAKFMQRAKDAESLRPIAERLGCTMGQLALAWCMANPNVSTTMTGATDPSQMKELLGSLSVCAKVTPELRKEIDEALGKEVLAHARRASTNSTNGGMITKMRKSLLTPGALSKL